MYLPVFRSPWHLRILLTWMLDTWECFHVCADGNEPRLFFPCVNQHYLKVTPQIRPKSVEVKFGHALGKLCRISTPKFLCKEPIDRLVSNIILSPIEWEICLVYGNWLLKKTSSMHFMFTLISFDIENSVYFLCVYNHSSGYFHTGVFPKCFH